MRYMPIRKEELHAWNETLPVELAPLIRDGRARAGGIDFAGVNAGSVVWMHDEKDGYGRLLAIDVIPEARRLGIGTELIREAVKEMRSDKLTGVNCSFGEYQDRLGLRPFLNACGLQTDVEEIPLGSVSLGEAIESLNAKGLLKEKLGCPVKNHTADDRTELRLLLDRISSGNSELYLKDKPGSYVIYDGENLIAAVLLSEEREGVISLDYLYNQGGPDKLTGLVATALSELKKTYPADTQLEMLLGTEQGQKLYEGVFGEAKEHYRLAVCSQSFEA